MIGFWVLVVACFAVLALVGLLFALFSLAPPVRRIVLGVLAVTCACGVPMLFAFRMYFSLASETDLRERPSFATEVIAGQTIGGGDRWSSEFEDAFVAGAYPTDETAAHSLAIRCASRIRAATAGLSEKPKLFIGKRPRGESASQASEVFAESVQNALPGFEIVEEQATGVVTVELRARIGRSGANMLFVPLTLNGMEEELIAIYRDLPWVLNDEEYQKAYADTDYFVARGSPSRGEEGAARDSAQEHLTPLIRDLMPEVTPYYDRYIKSAPQMSRIASRVTDSLTVSQFQQRFAEDVRGDELEPMYRDAILIDYSRPALEVAVNRAYRYVAYRSSTVGGEEMFGIGALSLGLFAVLWAVSWYFDRRRSRTIPASSAVA